MKSRYVAATTAVSCTVVSAIANAQTAPGTSDTSLQEVVVVATRTPTPLDRIGNSVTVLDLADIRQSQAVVMSDLLAQTPGITTTRIGGVGQPTSVFIRGAESDQTVVVIDGVVLNDPSQPGGGYDFENLLVGDTSRIEILRGAQSTLYGSQAIGGVINIVTADPTRTVGGSGSLEGGSHDTGYGTVSLNGKSDGLMWRVAGNYLGTSGIPAFDEYLGGKRDCASQIGSAAGQLRYELMPGWEVDLRGYYVQARTDFDGYDTPTGAFGDDNEYSKTNQAIGYAGLSWHSPDHTVIQRLAAQYTNSETREYDPDAPANFGAPSTETFYGIGRNARAEYQGTWRFSSAGQLVGGAQHEHSTIDTDTPALDVTPSPLNEEDTINSGYAQAQYEVVKGLTLTAGGRYDHHDVYGGHTTGQFAAAWVLPDQRTILRASFGQGFKAPSLYQLYSNYGNLALQPETANSWDTGIEHHALNERLVLSATYFERTSHDLIEFFDCTTPSPLCATEPFGYYANIERTRAKGVELVGTLRATSQLSLTANYSYIDAKDISPGSTTYGNELPRRPKEAGNAAVTYLWPIKLSTALALRYSGPSFDDAANQIRLGGYVLLDFRASLRISDRTEIYARVENLTDRHYETAYQYGTLGRSAYVGGRITF
ncbi:MAG: TonB-dependent receptor [Gammaproteobacteria bacterium]|nr:TonB-dependent receptor [Gammaproteobacteria bacterium]